MNGAAADIVSTHGEKPKQALSAAFNVMCPGLGGITNGPSTEASSEIVQGLGELINAIEGENLSCDQTKAGFQINVYLLSDLNQVTRICKKQF